MVKKEIRTAVFDEELQIEAFRFEGIIQPFPNHFHEYYVIGFVEKGERRLSCKNKEYILHKGGIVIFNPGDNHECVRIGQETLDYRGFHISRETMLELSKEVTGKQELPGFSPTVIYDEELSCCLRPLHQMIMEGSKTFENGIPECRAEIEKACSYMEVNYSEHICLDQICSYTGLSKSTLLRAFTGSKGVTPYRYLENIRINEAKKLLERGVPPIEAAMETGFSDQSHFTNYFSSFIGLSPGAYREIFEEKNRTGGKQHGE